MWICDRCGFITNEPESESYCYEDYNGVSGMFRDRHYGSYAVCPECGSEDIDEFICDDDCTECEHHGHCEEEWKWT